MSSEVTAGLTAVTSIGTTVIDFIVSNPIAMIFLGVALFGVGVGIFRKLKH